MKKLVTSAAALLCAQSAFAGGLDRSGQSITALFEDGRYAEFSLGNIAPDVSGQDVAVFGSQPTGNVADTYFQIGAAYKADVNDRLSYALIYDQPYGAGVEYDSTSVALGGTSADASSQSITGLMRYKLQDGFSVYGGLRAQSIEADVALSGAAYGALSGYNVQMEAGTGFGYVLGAAYERPDIALRVSLTYSSAIEHDLETTESLAPTSTSTTTVESPESFNLEFQTGIAADTLLFGSARFVSWDGFTVAPAVLNGAAGPLVEYTRDTTTFTLGVGRRFSPEWSGAVTLGYEEEGNKLVSPLGPTTGFMSLGVGGTYTTGNQKITAGVRYIMPGDASAETGTPDTARADFTGSSALAVGVKFAFQL